MELKLCGSESFLMATRPQLICYLKWARRRDVLLDSRQLVVRRARQIVLVILVASRSNSTLMKAIGIGSLTIHRFSSYEIQASFQLWAFLDFFMLDLFTLTETVYPYPKAQPTDQP